MKKVLLVAVAGMFVLASCKKDRTCECTTNGLPDTNGKTTFTKVTKKFMVNEAGCVSREYTEIDYDYNSQGVATKTSTLVKEVCVIK
jgi:hypothetical protein